MKALLITASDLAKRWDMNYHTLANWRAQGRGPKYIKVGGGVYYYLSDIQKMERKLRKKYA